MSGEFIDLDALLPEDIRVRLGGTDYKLPGDPPVELLLRLQLLAQKIDEAKDDSPENMLSLRKELAEELEELFAIRNDLGEDDRIELTDRQTAGLLNDLFEKYFAVEDGDRPTTPQKPRSSKPSRRRSPAKGRKAAASSTSSQT